MKKITHSVNINKLYFLLFIVFSVSASAQDIVFWADFNQITNGNNTEPTGSSTPWTGNAIFPSAGVVRAFEAGGAVRIGTGSQNGYITTTADDFSDVGYFTVSFEVKGWTTVEGDIKLILITPTGQTEQVFTYDAIMTSTFPDLVEVSYPGGESSVAIRIETTAKRAFIDNVMITTSDCGGETQPTATAQSFCGAAIVGDLMPNGSNINWYASASDVNPLSDTDALITQTYYVSQVASNGICESDRIPVSIAVNAIPQAPGTEPQTVCDGETILNLAANGISLRWYTDATQGEPLAPGDEVASATYYVSQTVNGCESARTAVAITVNSVAAPQAAPQGFCSGAIVDDLEAVGANILWYTSPIGSAALDSSEGITEGIYYASQTIDGCESERVSVSVGITEVEMPMGEGSQQFTTGQTLADLTVSGTNIVWYADEGLTTILPPGTVLTNGMTYYAVATEGLCLSAPLPVTVDDMLGTGQFSMPGISYYPNPLTDALTVSYKEALSNVTVYNLMGQQVFDIKTESPSVELDLSGLASGTYLLKVVSGQQSNVLKIVKL